MSLEDAAWELQRAMVAAALADAGLQTLMGNPVPAFDQVPERQPMPYLQYDEPGTAEWDVTPTETDGGFGHEHTIMIHVWSGYEGKKEINLIMRRLELIYRDFAASLTGHRLVNIRYQFSDRLRDPDNQAWHGVIQFRAVTEEN
jgi:hypothetical protein